MTIQPIPPDKAVLLFDGVCNLCNGFVQFLIQRDKKGKYLYASLQSDEGQALLREHGLSTEQIDTVVMIENGKAYTHSDVGLRVFWQLGGGWALLYPLRLLPKFFRDGVYNWIARNRYRWFGKRESCMLPRPEWKERFL